MAYAFIRVPAAPVRRKARHQAEMVNQLLFGEPVRILKEKKGNWFKVCGLHDQYEGWLTGHMLEPVSEEEARRPVEYLAEEPFNRILLQGQPTWIPAASFLPNFAGKEGKLGSLGFEWEGQVIRRPADDFKPDTLHRIVETWINAPYCWGGRTMMGVDCSGFVQIVFRMLGFDLPRDAWQQAQEGNTVDKLRNAQTGDLAFFDDKDEIVHVGILLSPEKIIHAAGRVRIDTIDKKGIIHSETGKRTHSLRVIKRTWQG